MTPVFSSEHAYGKCHALTAALLEFAPAGEAMGLFLDGSCIHSAFRVPNTDVLVDAFGPEAGAEALSTKAARFTRGGSEPFEWRRLADDDLKRMVHGDRSHAVRQARPVARGLLQAADELASSPPTLLSGAPGGGLRPLASPAVERAVEVGLR